jgi:hypothetical protein
MVSRQRALDPLADADSARLAELVAGEDGNDFAVVEAAPGHC